jgi:hypothetical protein
MRQVVLIDRTGSGLFCSDCHREMAKFWYDTDRKNGMSEQLFNGRCFACHTEHTGEEPKSLSDLNEERGREANKDGG